ncbi:MAG: ComF family protein [Lentisphaeria bacterium]|nr:ComF family protein [Lentisphaeria bacterium]
MAGIGEYFAKILGNYLPMDCPDCGGMPFDGRPGHFCADCLRKYRFVRSPVCPSCGATLTGILEVCPDCLHAPHHFPWKRGISVFELTGPVRDAVIRYKYRNHPEYARAFGQLAAGTLRDSGLKPDLLVPTPLHWFRYCQRGFNQAELLAQEMGRELGIPVRCLLRRKKWTRQQARLDREERIRNLDGAFSIRDSTNCKGRCILLIDDVMTTGSTLTAGARVLLDAGAAEVNVMVLARRQRD